jgi:hypothetical protein
LSSFKTVIAAPIISWVTPSCFILYFINESLVRKERFDHA